MAQNTDPERPGGENKNEQREAEQENRRNNQADDDRESIWTIPAKLKRWYFVLFSVQVVIATVWLIRTAILDESRNGVPEILAYLWLNMAPAAVSSATFALVIVDSVNGIMVLSTWLEETLEKRKQRQIKEASDKAAKEARAEVQMIWQEWNRRREDAAMAGEEFSEPPPGTVPDSQETQRH